MAPVRAWRQALRGHRGLALLLVAHVALATLLALHVLGAQGLLVAAALVALVLLLPPDVALRRTPIVFVIAWLALVGGEAWLRAHPTQVGGGGGGNPALAGLYADLYHYNALGLRGREVPREPGAGTFRILAIGDSFTLGQGLGEDDTWPARLERLLAEGRAGAGPPGADAHPEVLNAGRAGNDAWASADFLRETGLSLHPRLVILQFYVNDVQRRSAAADEPALAQLLTSLRAPLRSSYVLFWLRDQLHARPDLEDWLAAVANGVERGSPAWRDFSAALADCAAQLRAADVPLLVVLFPHPGPPRDTVARVHAAVTESCRRSGLRVLDLQADLATVPVGEQALSEMDQHGSAAYNAAAARAIADELAAAGLLPE